MPPGAPGALARHRERQEQRGIVRLEVQAHRQDVELVRGIVRALADPEQAADARAVLRAHFAADPATDLKALLAAAPLAGIVLDRDHEVDRPGWP